MKPVVLAPAVALVVFLFGLVGSPARADPLARFEEAPGLSCPEGFSPLRDRRESWSEDFCGRGGRPGRIERQGPITRRGPDQVTWFSGQLGSGGRRTGTWTVYRPDGTVKKEWDYSGELIPCPSGAKLGTNHVHSVYTCQLDRVDHGLWVAFGARLTLMGLGQYVHGSAEGTWVVWTPDGEVRSVKQYASGVVVWSWPD